MSSVFLVGLDGSPSSQKALAHAISICGPDGQLHLAAVASGPDIEMADVDERKQLLEKARHRCQVWLDDAVSACKDQDLTPETHLLAGQPAEELLGLAGRIRCEHIVLGHRRKGLFEQLLMGSVAKRVVDFAHCTVTVVR
ncbi:MAG: universal stress protein [Pseudomonadota bacterium]